MKGSEKALQNATQQKTPAPQIILLVAQVYTDGSIEPQGWHASDSVVATRHHCLLLSTKLQFMIAHIRVAVLETRTAKCTSHVAGDMK